MGFLNSLKDIFSLPDDNEIEKQNRLEAQNNIENTKWIYFKISVESRIELVPAIKKIFNQVNEKLLWKMNIEPCPDKLTYANITLSHPKGVMISPMQCAEKIETLNLYAVAIANKLGWNDTEIKFNKDGNGGSWSANIHCSPLIIGPWYEDKNNPPNILENPSAYLIQIQIGASQIIADITNMLELEIRNISLFKKIFGHTVEEFVKTIETKESDELVLAWLKGVKQFIRQKNSYLRSLNKK
ncbi:MAG: hypothetical protein V1702_00825 [Candidatus Woesearchaeota archaeon]